MGTVRDAGRGAGGASGIPGRLARVPPCSEERPAGAEPEVIAAGVASAPAGDAA